MLNLILAILPITFLISPGTYEGKTCLKEGLYRFHEYPHKTEQRIVYNGDILKLLESITWIHIHGYKDSNLSDKKKLEAARTRKISIACGDIARLTQSILSSIGVKSRIVQFITKEPRNNWSDGHLMIEVEIDAQWKLIDIDQRNLFMHGDQILSAEQMMSLGIDKVTIKKFSEAPLLSYNDLNADAYKYDFTLSSEEIFIRKDIRAWYKRVCQTYFYY